MKILMISNLYPYTIEKKTKETLALHNLYKFWLNNDEIKISVIKTFFLPTEVKTVLKNKVKRKKAIIKDGMEIVTFPILKIPKKNIFFTRNLVNYVSNEFENIDCVVVHRIFNALLIANFTKKKSIPLILGLHKSDVMLVKKDKEKYLSIFNYSKILVCRSHSIMKEIRNIYPHLSSKCIVAPSGIEESNIVDLDMSVQKSRKWKSHEPLKFITVASLIPLKNIDVNLRAFAKLSKKFSWIYNIIGDGPEMEYLKDLARKLEIDDKVIFQGNKSRQEVLYLLRKNDVFIMVSEPETFGLVYLEAMASGCVVLGAIDNGIDGVIIDSFNGFLCKPNDIDELTEKISKIVQLKSTVIEEILLKSHNTILNYTDKKVSEDYFLEFKKAIV
ncbi:glycosyltransferase family 4 protein [Planococcus ruber]|uniref:glycosyltransferase family 4 protein n=1 Tax=Planococcus ruber TaxID=2027871 RepID=UPI001FEF1778|nr:glycosyltransferase family 4 protein [Planococcus ruber]MCJ1908283.1 glycosyltransferase family 4 protein [Planococcus ruber]